MWVIKRHKLYGELGKRGRDQTNGEDTNGLDQVKGTLYRGTGIRKGEDESSDG